MSYRVETASSNRAVCQSTECKGAGIKIDKNELRLGTWVTYEDRGSWKWRHWGCVSGKQIQNMRDNLEDPNQPGVYRWDFLDGYDGGEKHSLDHHPDLQEKVRRVVTQGFIDPEDWNGDPEMNKLGETGLRTAASKKKMREDKKAQDNEIKELEAQVAALAAERDVLAANGSSTKEIDAKMDIAKERLEAAEKTPADKTPARKGAKAETEEKKPVKRKRVSKAKKEADTDDEEEVMPAKKSRAKKVKKEEADEEEEVIPAKKPRGKQVKKEEDEPAAAVSAAKKRAGKKQVTKEEADVSEPEQKPEVKKAPSKRGRANKAAVKEESDAAEAKEQQDFKKAPSKRVRGKKAVKEEAVEDAGVAAAVPPKEESVEEADIDANLPQLDGAADEEQAVGSQKKPRKAPAKKGAKKGGRKASK